MEKNKGKTFQRRRRKIQMTEMRLQYGELDAHRQTLKGVRKQGKETTETISQNPQTI